MNLKVFKNYGLWTSVLSFVPIILHTLGFKVIPEEYTAIVTTALSILVVLGIINDPNTVKKGYGDDMKLCPNCGEKTRHVMVNGQSLCANCGVPELNI